MQKQVRCFQTVSGRWSINSKPVEIAGAYLGVSNLSSAARVTTITVDGTEVYQVTIANYVVFVDKFGTITKVQVLQYGAPSSSGGRWRVLHVAGNVNMKMMTTISENQSFITEHKMKQSGNNNNKSSGWKFLVASFSLTSFIGLVNLFSGKDASMKDTSELDALINAPLPTLVPAASSTNDAAAPVLREVANPAPTPTPIVQNPVIERVTIGSSGSGSSSPSTKTSSSR